MVRDYKMNQSFYGGVASLNKLDGALEDVNERILKAKQKPVAQKIIGISPQAEQVNASV